MGVNPTPSNYKTFTFDNTNSAQYGVYITGQGVFNAPERNVEMVEIPGRDGAYALDKGNFNNIEVTYPAGIVADTEADFATAVSNLRNFLCSKTGYCRLTDDYNSGEYRMAIYKSGLEVDHEGLKTGEFNIVFECKPQRWLTSGETAVSVASGSDITNPTLFPSRPQLQVWGYGDIDVGGKSINVSNVPIGNIIVKNGGSAGGSLPTSLSFDDEYANSSDAISISDSNYIYSGIIFNEYLAVDSGTFVSGSATGTITGNGAFVIKNGMNLTLQVKVYTNALSFQYGTSRTETNVLNYSVNTSAYGSVSGSITFTVAYDGVKTFTLNVSQTFPSHVSLSTQGFAELEFGFVNNAIILNSSKSSLGNPMYLDLDIGEAYKIENGVAVSVNNAVTIPAELPTLPSGNTTITYDNTITQFKVLPRWWKV